MAQCYEISGQFERVDAEFERAAALAREAHSPSLLALILYNDAGFQASVPRFAACLEKLDEVDEVVERFGLRRFLLPARFLRASVSCWLGDVAGATEILAAVADLPAEGYEAWVRAQTRAQVLLAGGDVDAAIAEFDALGVEPYAASELATTHMMMRADALAWKGDIDGARRVTDLGDALARGQSDANCHGWFALVASRVEADAAVEATANSRLEDIERAQARAESFLAGWNSAVGRLRVPHPCVVAYSRGCDAEMARLRGEGVAEAAIVAAAEFDAISMPYYATYFRWRAAEAALDADDRKAGLGLLERARGDAHRFGFGGLDAVLTNLARSHQLRMGSGRTTVDGDVPLSERELEVLRLIVDGKSNPEIAEILSISAHTARAHVSNILRKLDTPTRVEAASAAVRGGLV